MQDSTFVGLHIYKATVSVAVAHAELRGEAGSAEW